jgi:hypothetical protein
MRGEKQDNQTSMIRAILGMGNLKASVTLPMPDGIFKNSASVQVVKSRDPDSVSFRGLFVPGLDATGYVRARILYPTRNAKSWFVDTCRQMLAEKSSMRVRVSVTALSGDHTAFVSPVAKSLEEMTEASLLGMTHRTEALRNFLNGDTTGTDTERHDIMRLAHREWIESRGGFIVYHNGNPLKFTPADRSVRHPNYQRKKCTGDDWISYGVDRQGYLIELWGGERLFDMQADIANGKIAFIEAVRRCVKCVKISTPALERDWFNICGFHQKT